MEPRIWFYFELNCGMLIYMLQNVVEIFKIRLKCLFKTQNLEFKI
jgi:hypothetical protein